MAAPGDAAPANPLPVGHEKVFILKGFMNVFSPGLDQLAEELRRRHISAEVANHLASASFASEAIADCKSGRVSSIIIVGHSLGATAAFGMADELQRAGVRVALVLTLDPVVRSAVPSNVARVKNFYLSNGMGTTIQAGDHFHGKLQNVDMKSNSNMGHVSLTTAPAIHRQMLEYIAGAAGGRCR